MINVQTTPGSDVPVFKSQDRQNFFYPHLNHLQIEKRRISELTMGKGNKVQDTQLRLSRQTQQKNKKTFKYSLLTLFSLSLSLSLYVCVCTSISPDGVAPTATWINLEWIFIQPSSRWIPACQQCGRGLCSAVEEQEEKG